LTGNTTSHHIYGDKSYQTYVDYMTKPLVGVKFERFRKLIMNLLSNAAITS
jgi:hypothetical protein